MSIMFGMLKRDDAFVTPEEMQSLGAATFRYGQGEIRLHAYGNYGMGLHPVHTHARSDLNNRLFSDVGGNVIAFDGRLDNYVELAKVLGLSSAEVSDVEVVLAAFNQWGEECFSRFVGDWAIALWCSAERRLFLGRDHAGTRTLYLREHDGEFTWSTYLDTFLAPPVSQRLSHDYVAAYLMGTQIRELTPYAGVFAVLPGHYVTVCKGKITQHLHWASLVTSSIRYKTDRDYEEHFLGLFQQAVARRSGPGAPVLGQLSGGMDSASIICISDHLRHTADPSADVLDTVSFYDPSDPDFNDHEYFSIVEAKRGRVGTHIEIGFAQRTFEPHDPNYGLYVLPGADGVSVEQERKFVELVWQKGYGSILSGIGGDEVLGGVPIGYPELAGHLLSGNIRGFFRQALAWSLAERDPLVATLNETARYIIRLYAVHPGDSGEPSWVVRSLRERSCQIAERRFASHLGVPPDKIDNHLAWWSILETMPHLFAGILYRPEYRYPFLDKDLVNYLFSIPREQLLRPGQRRSLMRRALRGIVPDQILNRRRKAFQLSGPLRGLGIRQPALEKLFHNSLLAEAGFIDESQAGRTLDRNTEGDPRGWQMLLRAIALELWLRTFNAAKQSSLQIDRESPNSMRLAATGIRRAPCFQMDDVLRAR